MGLDEVSLQMDLGVMITNDLKSSNHIKYITNKAFQRLGMIRRCFPNLTNTKLKILYTSLVQPILEYSSIIWNLYLQNDKD